MIVCSYFNIFIFNALPKAETYMKIIGAAYMVYLAIKIMKCNHMTNNNSSNSQNEQSKRSLYFSGVLMQLVNPKVILYGITMYSTFITPHFSSSIIYLLFAILLASLAFIATFCWALFGSIFNRYLSKYGKVFNIAMGIVLIFVAISILDIPSIIR